jgi:hypothetical protein
MVCALEDYVMKSRFVFGALAMAAFAACGGDDDGGGGIKVPDSGMQTQKDAPPAATCNAMADYGSPTPMAQGALRYCATQTALVKCPTTATTGTMGTAADPIFVVYVAQLNAANDFFSFEMWKGTEPFLDKIKPAANINLGDATQSQWKTCSACAYVQAQVNTSTGDDMGLYLANAGTANVTAATFVNDATMTKLTGSVSSVMMQHVDIDMTSFMSTPSADGCKTMVSGMTFDLAVRDPMMMATSDPLNKIAAQIAARASARLAQ